MEAMTKLDRGIKFQSNNNYFLKKWEIICGGITTNIKVNIIRKELENKKINKLLSQTNNEINNIIAIIERLENPKFQYSLRANNVINEKNKEYFRIDDIKKNIKLLEDLLNKKKLLIKKKEEVL